MPVNSVLPKPKGPTISFIKEDEFQLHLLYRRRIVEEDTLINHRMTWLIASQAFLFAIWAVFLQRALDSSVAVFGIGSFFLASLGILFAMGSIFSIKAAQDEIALLRANYLALVRREVFPDQEARKGFFAALWEHLSLRGPYTHPPGRLEAVRERLEKDPLPGLTGSRNFHQMGHLVPKYLPVIIAVLWFVLLLAATFALFAARKLADLPM